MGKNEGRPASQHSSRGHASQEVIVNTLFGLCPWKMDGAATIKMISPLPCFFATLASKSQVDASDRLFSP